MKFFYKKLVLEVPETVYYPEEDSILMAKTLENMKLGGKCLEIGCGSGLLSIIMARQGDVTAADISPAAVECTKSNAALNKVNLHVLESDLFANVSGKFDVIVFNPPYLPEGVDSKHLGKGRGQLIGRTGREAIEKFISHAGKRLNKGGKILLLISSLTGEKEVLDLFQRNGFKAKIVSREKIPWEELMVMEANL